MEERLSRLSLDDKISNELWAHAISNLEGVFPKDINFSYDKSSILSDLKREVEEAQNKCDEKRLSYTRKSGEKVFLRNVLGKIIKWVNIFKETGDMAVQYDPGHAALPWALVRFLLQVAVADVEKYEFLVDNLEDVSRYMCRCKILERLYGGDGELGEVFKASLVGLYGQLLLYLAKAKAYFAKRTIGKHLLIFLPMHMLILV